MLKKLDMVTVRVRDWPAAVAWYRDVLGLSPLGLHDHPFCLMAFPEGEATIALDGTNPAAEAAGNWQPSIQVDDLAATVEALRERGVAIGRAMEGDEEEGYRVATIADPEGNPITLYDYT
jgi:predicted enzyme related to lactoylglutathione lyase